MLMTHKQSNVTVMLNERHYSSEIAVFDMFIVILTTHSRVKTTIPLADATVNETL